MAAYNRVILVGNLTRDPQLSYTPNNNTPVAEFGLATTHKWRGQDGQDHEETCFVDCSLYGRGAEVFNQYMSKGRPVLVEGRLRYRQWEAQDGQKRNKLSVIVEKFQFLGGPRTEAGPRGDVPAARPSVAAPMRPQRPAATPAVSQGAGEPLDEQPGAAYDEDGLPPPSDADVPF